MSVGRGRYGVLMTALGEVGHDRTPARHPLAPGASPEVIREHLLSEDRKVFDLELSNAQRSDLAAAPGALSEVLEEWRCVAIVQQDRARFVRTARRAAEHRTGEPSADDEPLAVTRAKAGM